MATTALPSAANTSSLLVFKGAIGYTKANERAALLAGISDSKKLEYKTWFRRLDTMNHGYVEIEELEYRLSNENLVRASNEIGLIAAEMDTDGNGILDFEEFAIMMCFLENLARQNNEKDSIFLSEEEAPDTPSPPVLSLQFWIRIRQATWTVFEDPSSSRIAGALSILIISLIILSTVALVMETMPSVEAESEFAVIEALTAVVFSIEFVARLLSTGNLRHFARSPMNWVDFLSVLPWYLGKLFVSNETQLLRVLRVVRVVRVFKLSRYFTSLGLLTRAFANSGSAMAMAFFLTILGVLLLGSIMFYIERGSLNEVTNQLEVRPGQPSRFYSILQSCWWCIVTITSVGYGDVTPVTELGRAVGGFISVFGVVLLAFPVSIFSANFAEVYGSFKRKQALHVELQRSFVPVVQGKTGTSLLQSLLVHLPRISLAERLVQLQRSGHHRKTVSQRESFNTTVAVPLASPRAKLQRSSTAPSPSLQSSPIQRPVNKVSSRRVSESTPRKQIVSTPTRTSFFTPPPTSPNHAVHASGFKSATRLSRSVSSGLLLAGDLPELYSRLSKQPAHAGDSFVETETWTEHGRNEGGGDNDESPSSTLDDLPWAVSSAVLRRTRSWGESRNPSNHYANSSTSTHSVNLLASNPGGAMSCVPIPLHNTNKGTGRNRLRTLRRSMSDSDIDTPVQPFGGVLGSVHDINPFGKGKPRAGAGYIESDEMVLTADSFIGLDLADSAVMKYVVSALLRDSRKRLWQRIRRVELRLRDDLMIEISRRWRVWFGVHAAAVVVAATPFTIDRVKMAFQVRHCRVIPAENKLPPPSDAYKPHVQFLPSIESVMSKVKEHVTAVTPERYSSFRSPPKHPGGAGAAAGVFEVESVAGRDYQGAALPNSALGMVESDRDSKLMATNHSLAEATARGVTVHDSGASATGLPATARMQAFAAKVPPQKTSADKDDDPVSWHREGALGVPAEQLATLQRQQATADSQQSEGTRSSGELNSETDSDLESDATHDIVYIKKVRTVKRLTASGEQVTETETRIVKKRVRRSKRTDTSNRSILAVSDSL